MTYRLLRASAGTGKTYQLVQAYVREVVQMRRRPSEVVAITFTRKAAAELKARIRRALEEEVRAGKVPREVLGELPRAPIANFHVLSMQLLRTFGLAGRIPEGVSILGEFGDDRLLFLDACEEAWFGGDALVGAAVERVSYHLPPLEQPGLASALWEAIAQAREDGRPIADALFAQYDAEGLRREQHTLLMQLRSGLERALPEQSPAQQEKLRLFLCQPPPAADAPLREWMSRWQQLARFIDRRAKYKEIYTKELSELMKEDVRRPLAEALSAQLRPDVITLTLAAWRRYQQKKESARVVDFGDLVEQLVELLSTRRDLHGAVRRRFRSVLVDEAQDTNRLQRRLVYLLAGLEGPAADDEPKASLLVVGDRKQAIYTFRGADPDAFDVFARDLEQLGGGEESLSVSRRSSAELVAAINSLGTDLFDSAYEALEPLCDEAGRPEKPLGRPGMTFLELPPIERPTPATTLDEASRVATYVRQRLDAGGSAGDYAVLLRAMSDAPVYLSSFARLGIPAVLAGGGGLYAQPEIADVVSLVSWLVDRRDLLAAAVALRSPLCGVSDSGLLALLGGNARRADGLTGLRQGRISVTSDTPEDAPLFAHLAQVLPSAVRAARSLGAGELLAYLDELLDMRAVYLGLANGEQRVANLDRLFELARQFDASGKGGTARFARRQLERIRARHDEPLVPVPAAARRAVTVSTVHQAKGLEYPVVLLPDLRRGVRPDGVKLRYSREHGIVLSPEIDGKTVGGRVAEAAREAAARREEDERRRLMYVAVTRACDEVVIFGRDERAGKNTFGSLVEGWAKSAATSHTPIVARGEAPPPMEPPAGDARTAPSAEAVAWAEAALARLEPSALPPGARLDLPVTLLESYDQCLRRGFFLHEMGLPEPHGAISHWNDDRDPPLDPLSRGRLVHAVLAAMHRSQGDVEAFVAAEIAAAGYDADDPRLADVRADAAAFLRSSLGRQIAALPAERRRAELPFQLGVEVGAALAVIHGQIDLVYWDEEGPVIVDYKHARRGAAALLPYVNQLDGYAAALAQLTGSTAPIRTRLVFLRDREAALERVVTAELRRAWQARVARIVAALSASRLGVQRWPGQERRRCEQLACGFMERCHGPAAPLPTPATPEKARQLVLF